MMDYNLFVIALGLAVAVPAGIIIELLIQIRDNTAGRPVDDWMDYGAYDAPPAPSVAPEIHYHLHYHASPALPAVDAPAGLAVRNGERPAALVVPEARRLEVR